MGKQLRPDTITAEDLKSFVESDSDFAFEMKVLSQLRKAGFACSHSGTYSDPVTGKVRQFDIRAEMTRECNTVALVVECKNFRPNNPLLLSAVPRTEREAFHDLLTFNPFSHVSWVSFKPVTGSAAAYRPGEMVGKRTDQVGRELQTGTLNSNDETTFDKLNQAVNSCQDLVREFATESVPGDPRWQTAVVPLLVVPDGCLWQVEYDENGIMTAAPRKVAKAALFYDHTWTAAQHFGSPISYRLSHVELMTFSALSGLEDRCFGASGFFR